MLKKEPAQNSSPVADCDSYLSINSLAVNGALTVRDFDLAT